MTADDVEAVGRLAYVWGWPLVNMANRADRAALMTHDGKKPRLIQGTPVGYEQLVMQTKFVRPYERVICCPSRDVIYGSGVFHLTGSPGVVIQVPDFGDRYWLYSFYDARTNEFSKIGKQYNTKSGFHLLVGPKWKGRKPTGIDKVWRSSTDLAIVIPRIYTDGTKRDLKTILPLIRQICSYPIGEFVPGVMVTRNWEKLRNRNPILLKGRGPEARFVKPEQFFEDLSDVMESVPKLPGEEALYDKITDVLDQARRRPLIGLRLERAFTKADGDTIAELMQWDQNGVDAGNGWYTSVNAADWTTPVESVYLARAATAKSNMLENRAEETKYYYTDTDSSGDLLYGSNLYAITFPKDQLLRDHVHRAFWSISVYDKFHFFNTKTNPLDRYSLGTKDENSFVYESDGSLKLYASAAQPQQGTQNWLPAPDGEPFSLYIRAYWPDDFILNGTWQPPKVVKLS